MHEGIFLYFDKQKKEGGVSQEIKNNAGKPVKRSNSRTLAGRITVLSLENKESIDFLLDEVSRFKL